MAAAARKAGAEVTVLDSAELPLLAVLGREMAEVFAGLHRDNGVDLRLGVAIDEVLTDGGKAVGVRLADGTELPADAVIAGVGAAPRLELASSAGLELGSGVLVDAALRSSDPDIWAVGDIAEAEHPVLGHRVRVEHWATALNQPAVAAASILGRDASYDRLPYFFSDQFDLGMEYVGHAGAGSYARVIVRGDLAGREFVAFWLDGEDHVLAGMNVNVWDVTDDVKALIAGHAVVDVDRLADAAVPLGDVAAT